MGCGRQLALQGRIPMQNGTMEEGSSWAIRVPLPLTRGWVPGGETTGFMWLQARGLEEAPVKRQNRNQVCSTRWGTHGGSKG